MRVEDVYVNIKNFDFLVARARPQIAAVKRLKRDGLLDEREAGLLVQRIGAYISNHIEIELEVPPTKTPIPTVFEDAFKEQ